MPGNRRIWGITVSEYMIDIALTTEFVIDGGLW
jgi:hypothetical protein